MATCQSCFKKIPDNAGHCPHCGTAQQQTDGKKTVFGYAASAELQELQKQAQQQAQQQAQAAPAPEGGDALAKTMFAQGDSQPHPAQEPAHQGPRVRAPQIDPALRTPLSDPVARATAQQPQQQRPTAAQPAAPAAPPPSGPAPGATPAGGYPPTMAGAPAAKPSPAGGYPPTMAASTSPPPANPVPPTMAAPAPAATAAPPKAAPPPRVASVNRKTGRVSAGLYLAFILGGAVAAGVFTGIVVANLSHMDEALPFTWMPSILSGIFFCVLLHKAWAAIQDGQTPVSPGAAVGYLFVPFYNLYWIFIAFGSWAKHYNAYVERNGINAPRMSEGLFLAYPICCVVPIANLAGPVLAVIVILKWCEGINAIADAAG